MLLQIFYALSLNDFQLPKQHKIFMSVINSLCTDAILSLLTLITLSNFSLFAQILGLAAKFPLAR